MSYRASMRMTKQEENLFKTFPEKVKEELEKKDKKEMPAMALKKMKSSH